MQTEAEVLAVSASWDAALVANDPVGFAGFATNDWVYVGPAGQPRRATSSMPSRAGRLAHHTMRTIGVPRVAAYGDTAIMTARKASTGAWDGVPYDADEWISEVYVRQGGRWLCALSQKCPGEP